MELPKKYTYAPLTGKKILLGVTGSVAIYRSIDLARELIRRGARVKVLMTPTAQEFIQPKLFHWATGLKPVTSLSGEAEHISLSREYHAMVIAPTTLKTMAEIAYGIGDTPVSLTAIAMLGRNKPVIVVPTMNISLYWSPQYRRVYDSLRGQGVKFVPPYIIEDKVKFPPLRDLVYCIQRSIELKKELSGLKVLVTAGPTREYIDPVRVITNPSSGLMGVYLALEFSCRGAETHLVHGPMSVEPPYCSHNYSIETTHQMASIVKKLGEELSPDIAVFAAAPADYRPISRSPEKIPTRLGELTVKLRPTLRVIKALKNRPRVLVAFAAETVRNREELVEKARNKLRDYRADIIVANNVLSKETGFGKEFLDVCIVYENREECPGIIHKEELAKTIADAVINRLGGSS